MSKQCMKMSQQHDFVVATANHTGVCVSESVASMLKKMTIFLHSAQDFTIIAVLGRAPQNKREISSLE